MSEVYDDKNRRRECHRLHMLTLFFSFLYDFYVDGRRKKQNYLQAQESTVMLG